MRRLLPLGVCIGAAIVLAVVSLLGVLLGPTSISLPDVLGILFGNLGFPVHGGWKAWEETVILQVRMPRVTVAAFVGAGLAMAGAALQGLFRNPLASPAVLGVSSGASLGAVITLYVGLASFSVWVIPVSAIIGATVTALVVYASSTHRGHTPAGTLLLAGIAVGSLNTALISFVLSISLAQYDVGRQILFWLLGGLDGRTWDHVKIVAPITFIGAAIILAYARDLDNLLIGEIHAASVGVDVPRVRNVMIVASSCIVGGAVAVSGMIGFVGLVVPHVIRLLIGPGHRWLLPATFLSGAAFVVAADLLARTIIAPDEIRLGVITATVGAPFFLYLLIQRRREVTL